MALADPRQDSKRPCLRRYPEAQSLAAAARHAVHAQSAVGTDAVHVPREPLLHARPPAGPAASRHPGVHALEVYVPRHCATAAALEAAHGVAGKYTAGLLMREWAACDEDEDVVSMALTAVRRLLEAHGVRHEEVGML